MQILTAKCYRRAAQMRVTIPNHPAGMNSNCVGTVLVSD